MLARASERRREARPICRRGHEAARLTEWDGGGQSARCVFSCLFLRKQIVATHFSGDSSPPYNSDGSTYDLCLPGLHVATKEGP